MSDDDLTSDDDPGGIPLFDETIDIERVLQALDHDLERRLSIARRLEPILRDIVAYYGVPPDNWHSFGVVFRFDAGDSGETGMEIGGMGLRASGARERAPGAPATVHVGPKRPDTV
ncbi:hypothetical protein ACUSIJ_11720 [Pseudochelatococcus sp. B33]